MFSGFLENKTQLQTLSVYDFEDWETTNTLFKYLNRVWRPFTIDRFTDNKNIIAYWFHTFQKQICIKFDFS